MEINSWYKMRKLLFIFTLLLLCSCYKNVDLNDYDEYYKGKRPNPSEYFWYYDKELFKNAESCQLVGEFVYPNCPQIHYANRNCIIYDYTIYPTRKNINSEDSTHTCFYCKKEHNIYQGRIIINNVEHFVKIKLN